MYAGRMKYRLKVSELVVTRDKFNAEKSAWVDRGCIHAERVKQTARRSDELGEHFPDHSATYNIRDAHKIKENWRVEELGGNLYTVTAIVPNKDRGMLTLYCERVNQ